MSDDNEIMFLASFHTVSTFLLQIRDPFPEIFIERVHGS